MRFLHKRSARSGSGSGWPGRAGARAAVRAQCASRSWCRRGAGLAGRPGAAALRYRSTAASRRRRSSRVGSSAIAPLLSVAVDAEQICELQERQPLLLAHHVVGDAEPGGDLLAGQAGQVEADDPLPPGRKLTQCLLQLLPVQRGERLLLGVGTVVRTVGLPVERDLGPAGAPAVDVGAGVVGDPEQPALKRAAAEAVETRQRLLEGDAGRVPGLV